MTFIEIILSISILTFGIIEILHLYLRALNCTQNAYWKTIAILQLKENYERNLVGDNNRSDWKNKCNAIMQNGSCYDDGDICKVCWYKGSNRACVEYVQE